MAETFDEMSAADDAEAFLSVTAQAAGTMQALEASANGFARAMTSAFASAVAGGRRFDDVLKSLVLRLSDMALKAAFRPLAQGFAEGFQGLFGSLFGGTGSAADQAIAASAADVRPFASGGVIAQPTYFPLPAGGLGLAGEAGPEAVLPLRRGTDGRLGVAAPAVPAAAPVTIHIATPDLESFRRSEAYVTGQIARAVARGQRGL